MAVTSAGAFWTKVGMHMGGHAMRLPFLTPVQGCRKVRASLPFLRLARPFRTALIDSSGALGLFVKVGKTFSFIMNLNLENFIFVAVPCFLDSVHCVFHRNVTDNAVDIPFHFIHERLAHDFK